MYCRNPLIKFATKVMEWKVLKGFVSSADVMSVLSSFSLRSESNTAGAPDFERSENRWKCCTTQKPNFFAPSSRTQFGV